MRYNTSMSDPGSGLAPEAGDFLANMQPVYIGLTATCGALTLITLAIYLSQLLFIFKYLGTWTLRFHAAFLLSIYSVYSLLSMVTLFVPRSIPINDMVSGIYISIGLYIFVRLLAGNFGGAAPMMDRLKGESMSLRSPPVCCCFCCLPTLTVSRKIVIILEITVLQYGIFRPFLAYFQAVVMAEKMEDFEMSAVFSRGAFLITSTLIAMYGLQLLYRLCLEPLKHIPLSAKFRCLQIVLIIDNMQSSLLLTLGSNDVIPSDDGLSPQTNSYRIHRMITVVEMLLLAVIARIYYRQHMQTLIQSTSPSVTFPRNDSVCSTAPIILYDTNGETNRELPNNRESPSNRETPTNIESNRESFTKLQSNRECNGKSPTNREAPINIESNRETPNNIESNRESHTKRQSNGESPTNGEPRANDTDNCNWYLHTNGEANGIPSRIHDSSEIVENSIYCVIDGELVGERDTSDGSLNSSSTVVTVAMDNSIEDEEGQKPKFSKSQSVLQF